MIELLSTLTLTEVFIFGALILIALKEVLTLYDFFKKRINSKYDEENNEKQQIIEILEELKSLKNEIHNHEEDYLQLYESIEELKDEWNKKEKEQQNTLKLLIKSDKDAIKSFIVKEHHHFIEEEWIDDFSLDVIERRYTHYKEEGGNSYIHDLMQEIRELPNKPPKS